MPVAKDAPAASWAPAVVAAAILIAQQVVGRATRDALFLSTFDVANLPAAGAVAAVVSHRRGAGIRPGDGGVHAVTRGSRRPRRERDPARRRMGPRRADAARGRSGGVPAHGGVRGHAGLGLLVAGQRELRPLHREAHDRPHRHRRQPGRRPGRADRMAGLGLHQRAGDAPGHGRPQRGLPHRRPSSPGSRAARRPDEAGRRGRRHFPHRRLALFPVPRRSRHRLRVPGHARRLCVQRDRGPPDRPRAPADGVFLRVPCHHRRAHPRRPGGAHPLVARAARHRRNPRRPAGDGRRGGPGDTGLRLDPRPGVRARGARRAPQLAVPVGVRAALHAAAERSQAAGQASHRRRMRPAGHHRGQCDGADRGRDRRGGDGDARRSPSGWPDRRRDGRPRPVAVARVRGRARGQPEVGRRRPRGKRDRRCRHPADPGRGDGAPRGVGRPRASDTRGRGWRRDGRRHSGRDLRPALRRRAPHSTRALRGRAGPRAGPPCHSAARP